MVLSFSIAHIPVEIQHRDAMLLLCAMLASALLVSLVVLFSMILSACPPIACACTWSRMCMKRCQRTKGVEVITIEDSPMPTMKFSSPFKPTPTPRRRAVYRGGRRRSMHRRSSTVRYNPTMPHHCGYSCVLKLKGENMHVKKVKGLRTQVALRLEEHYWRGDEMPRCQRCCSRIS